MQSSSQKGKSESGKIVYGKTVSSSRVTIAQLMRQEHANNLGNVHGGWIMMLVDEAGALACMSSSVNLLPDSGPTGTSIIWRICPSHKASVTACLSGPGQSLRGT